MRKFMVLILAISIVTLLAACGGGTADKDKKDSKEETKTNEPEEVKVSDEEKVGEDEVVVQINDSKVKGTLYNAVYAQTKMQMHQIGQDVSDKESLKNHALDEIIAQELLKQDAKKQGVEVSKDEVQSELEAIKKENEEQLTAYLKEFQLTEDAFKEQLQFGLVLEKYVDEKMKVEEVSDKEAKKMYDQLKEQNKEIAAYDELEDQIKDSLKKQKQQEKLQAKLEELKKDAKIEKMI